jgi:glutathione S-transferase
MRVVYHYPLCPYSRKVRLALTEKKLDFNLEHERFWEKRSDFLKLNPAGEVPVLVDLNGSSIPDSYAIIEYLDETYPERLLMGESPLQRAEVRRLCVWFDYKFARDVTLPLLMEKNLKRYVQNNASYGPNSANIRQAQSAMTSYLEYICWLVDRRNWLGGEQLSMADIAAAAHLSVIDYFGDVPWDKHVSAKEWYMRIKSRPSFRGILQDRVPGIMPALHYPNLDF